MRKIVPDALYSRITNTTNRYCEGFFNHPEHQGYYIFSPYVTVAVVKNTLKSRLLNEIVAFDTAETNGAYLGQTNMITVSSFCGIKGLIWGLDICQVPLTALDITLPETYSAKVLDAEPLFMAFEKLMGTCNEPRFPFLPGSHVPCAKKSIEKSGPVHIYGSIAIGIPKDRTTTACLIMEDCGILESSTCTHKIREEKMCDVVMSVLEIGKNQNIIFENVFVGFRSIFVPEDHTGCALVCGPFFTIPSQAIPPSHNLGDITIDVWESEIKQLS